MDLDDLKDKYRAYPAWARLIMALIVGIVPGACSYFDEVEVVEAGLLDAQGREDAARIKFEANRRQKANIPKLEEELVFTEGQLEKASKKLPEGYLIETILALTASNAKHAGVNLVSFKPSCELKGQADFKYVEREIAVTASGKFQQLAGFFDKMVHSDVMLFLREIVLEPGSNENRGETGGAEVSQYQLAERARRNLILNATFKVVVFRAMKDDETAMFEGKVDCSSVVEMPNERPVPQPIPAGAPQQ